MIKVSPWVQYLVYDDGLDVYLQVLMMFAVLLRN